MGMACMEGHQGAKFRVPSNGENWDSKDLAQGDLSSPSRLLAMQVRPLIFPTAGHAVRTLPRPLLPWHVTSHVADPPRGGTGGVRE